MNEQEHIRRAEQARMILESPLWVEAWEFLRERCISNIEGASAADVEAIMLEKRLMLVANDLRGYFERLITDGKISTETVKLAERRKKWFTI